MTQDDQLGCTGSIPSKKTFVATNFSRRICRVFRGDGRRGAKVGSVGKADNAGSAGSAGSAGIAVIAGTGGWVG